MPRKTLIALTMTAMLLAGSGLAIAQQRGARADADNDGVITRAEAAAHPMLAQRFDALDANKDGRLTADERAAMRQHMQGKRGKARQAGWMRLDADKDGRVSRAEAAGKPQLAQRFAQLDMNKDGYLDQADRQARRAQHRAECFAKADADRNGQLSRGEFDRMREVCAPQRGGRGR